MDASKPSIAEAIKTLAAASEDRLPHHPEPEELAKYHRGEMAEEAAVKLQGHLEMCRECSALLLDLIDIEATKEVDEQPIEAAWQEFRQSLGTPQDPAPQSMPEVIPPVTSSRPQRWRIILPMAAFFAGLCLPLPWLLTLQQTVDELRQPQWNASVLDLTPASSLRADSQTAPGEVRPIELPEDQRFLTLILNPQGKPLHPSYRGRILDSEGRELSSAPSLEPTPFGNFALTLPRHVLPSGPFRVELYGVDPDGETLIDAYDLQWVSVSQD